MLPHPYKKPAKSLTVKTALPLLPVHKFLQIIGCAEASQQMLPCLQVGTALPGIRHIKGIIQQPCLFRVPLRQSIHVLHGPALQFSHLRCPSAHSCDVKAYRYAHQTAADGISRQRVLQEILSVYHAAGLQIRRQIFQQSFFHVPAQISSLQ